MAISHTFRFVLSRAFDQRTISYELCVCGDSISRFRYALLSPLRVNTPTGRRLSMLNPLTEIASGILVTAARSNGLHVGDGIKEWIPASRAINGIPRAGRACRGGRRFSSLMNRACVLLLALESACVPGARSTGSGSAHWVGSWEAPPQLTEPRNLPPPPGLSAGTLRQVIHLSAGGTRVRIRFSNEFGASPLSIGRAHLAPSRGGDSIDSAGYAPILFRGDSSVTIPPGEAVVSDEAECTCAPLSEITVSVYVTQMPLEVTGHPGSRTTSYLASGNHVMSASLPRAVKTEHWYVLSSVDVLSRAQSAAVVILGNSIADGRGSGTDRNNRWPDNLARRLQGDPRTTHVAVLNAGIGGNTVLRGRAQPSCLVGNSIWTCSLNQRHRWLYHP